jgi:hypothetical protein
LREWLSPAQLKQYDEAEYFHVTGSSTGRRYRIRRGTTYNVAQLDPGGRRLADLCFGPAGHLVPGDVMLAQKIALETNELMALNIANVRSAGGELRPGGVTWADAYDEFRPFLPRRNAVPAEPPAARPERVRDEPAVHPRSWMADWGQLGRDLLASGLPGSTSRAARRRPRV